MRVYVHRRPVRFSDETISTAVGEYLVRQLPQAYLDEFAGSDGVGPVLCVNGWRIGIWGRRVTERRKGLQEAQQWLRNSAIEAVCILWYPDVLYTCADEEVLWRRLRSDRFDGVLLRTAGVGIVGSALFRMQLAGIARTLMGTVFVQERTGEAPRGGAPQNDRFTHSALRAGAGLQRTRDCQP